MMKNNKIKLFFLVFIALILLITGIGCEKEANVLNFALSNNPDTLDPHKTTGTPTFQTLRSVYDTLVEPDLDGKLVPALAESWTVSDDSLTWTFKLRRGVTFHNGDKFTSQDVRATIERVTAEATASPSAAEFQPITGIETPDDYTIIFHLEEPYAPLLSSLGSGWGAILPKSLIDSGHDFGSHPVGTGPFVFSEWVRDSKITLEKNTDYWIKGHPKIDVLNINIIPEPGVRTQALLTGELDAIFNVNQEDIPILEENPEVEVEKRLTSLVMVLTINTSRAPLDDLRVRQAISLSIDRQKTLNIAYGGGKPVGTFMDVSDPYYKDFTSLYPHDPEKASALLAEVLRDSKADAFREIELVLPQDYEPHVVAGELYQEMLSKIGLTVKIKLVEWSTWISEVYGNANFDLTVIGHTGKLDPDGRLTGYGRGGMYVRWTNEKFADLIDAARRTAGFDDRKVLYDQALEIMAEEVPFAFVGSSYRYIALRSNVTGFRMDAKLDSFDFRYIEKK